MPKSDLQIYETPNGFGVRRGAARVAGMFANRETAQAWIDATGENVRDISATEFALACIAWVLIASLAGVLIWTIGANLAGIGAGLFFVLFARMLFGGL